MISDLLRACSSLVFAAFSATIQHAGKRLCGKLYVIFGAESAAKRWFSHDYSVFWQNGSRPARFAAAGFWLCPAQDIACNDNEEKQL
ncbi:MULTISPECIES: hypothetical protein [unclassified Herbaspirillum]|uniref:hypothetical protein n=1 Tax=unclassified Herbaspirillum TaxID=2624150 RepID=UPI0010721414|nr:MULTISPECIES: hypothetical protein [unclassified Herbaspirillum]TFI08316.1 hypothetical protein E4P32_09105 [Herbaspirillum sp. 3R11]TFI14731.1 hypothetical protein E4P31_09100 [Herbaspirillum sp. 3R-11]TFI31877.1 hypothetical protein E4P30_00050 [Herbaspirillum sp. 3C11]TFI32040.1 hypothetical protein E4P30_00990 [Herbaspirillum sp. 3C11]